MLKISILSLIMILVLAGCITTETPAASPPPPTVTDTPVASPPPPEFTGTPTGSPTPTIITSTPAPIPATPTGLPGGCTVGDQIPYVYHVSRLTRVTSCSHAIGMVDALRQEADGDIHLALQCANDACKALLTQGNTTYQHGDLVVEYICVYPPTQTDAIQPCAADPDAFKPAQAPQVGQCVWIDGGGVNDTVHNWGEIHPVGASGPQTGGCAGMTAKGFTLEAEPDDGG